MKKVYIAGCVVIFLISFGLSCSKGSSAEPARPPAENVVTLATVVADTIESVTISSAEFKGIISSNGNSAIVERGICSDTVSDPVKNKTVAAVFKTNGEFSVSLKSLQPGTKYYTRGYAINAKGTAYSNQLSFTTLAVPTATVSTDTMYASGATTVFAAGMLLNDNGATPAETGICIAKSMNPTIADKKVKTDDARQPVFLLRINDLEPGTEYYIRAYSTNEFGATGYGDNVKVLTIKKGHVTYTLNEDPNASDEVKANYARIKTAFDGAVVYYNEFTSIEKQLSVNYSPGTPTADASISGYIRVGSNTGYQRIGTALHEMAHAVGVGQHWMWSANFIRDGIYQGFFANRFLQFMTRDATAFVKGDTQHFWPYGINGANEDTAEEMLYIINTLIIQGMKKDGLPSNN